MYQAIGSMPEEKEVIKPVEEREEVVVEPTPTSDDTPSGESTPDGEPISEPIIPSSEAVDVADNIVPTVSADDAPSGEVPTAEVN